MSQSGAPEGQSALPWHCTQACVTGSQRGVAPPQVASVAHAPHACATQTSPALHPRPSSHWTQALSSQCAGAAQPPLHEGQQRPDWHMPPPVQSLERPHWTQRFMSGSQRGRPAVVQWASVTQATQRPDPQWSEGSRQSPSLLQVASSNRRSA